MVQLAVTALLRGCRQHGFEPGDRDHLEMSYTFLLLLVLTTTVLPTNARLPPETMIRGVYCNLLLRVSKTPGRLTSLSASQGMALQN